MADWLAVPVKKRCVLQLDVRHVGYMVKTRAAVEVEVRMNDAELNRSSEALAHVTMQPSTCVRMPSFSRQLQPDGLAKRAQTPM